MNYRMSENYEEEILRLNRKVKELLAYAEKGEFPSDIRPQIINKNYS